MKEFLLFAYINALNVVINIILCKLLHLCRDKNKDVVSEEYKKLMGELKDLYKTLLQRVFEYADAQKK